MAYIFKNAQGVVVAASAAESFGEDWTFVEENSKEYLLQLFKLLQSAYRVQFVVLIQKFPAQF